MGTDTLCNPKKVKATLRLGSSQLCLLSGNWLALSSSVAFEICCPIRDDKRVPLSSQNGGPLFGGLGTSIFGRVFNRGRPQQSGGIRVGSPLKSHKKETPSFPLTHRPRGKLAGTGPKEESFPEFAGKCYDPWWQIAFGFAGRFPRSPQATGSGLLNRKEGPEERKTGSVCVVR